MRANARLVEFAHEGFGVEPLGDLPEVAVAGPEDGPALQPLLDLRARAGREPGGEDAAQRLAVREPVGGAAEVGAEGALEGGGHLPEPRRLHQVAPVAGRGGADPHAYVGGGEGPTGGDEE